MKRIALLIALLPIGLTAQAPYLLPPPQLDQLVARVALYPDPLLAQVLAGATYYNQIPDAARWSDEHHYLRPPEMAAAISADRVPWDPSVQALLPFPQILDMMARDMSWTQRIGDAFLAQPGDVMDAVQRERRLSYEYGYLRTNPRVIVNYGRYIEIVPVGAGIYYVPVYDPAIVYYRPRPGFFVGGAINFGFGVSLGLAFRPWGWGYSRFGWGEHAVIINNTAWNRTYINRTTYVHPFNDARVYRAAPGAAAVQPQRPAPAARVAPDQRPEQHQLQQRSQAERQAFSNGRQPQREEHARPQAERKQQERERRP
jgi:hypothetical protein